MTTPRARALRSGLVLIAATLGVVATAAYAQAGAATGFETMPIATLTPTPDPTDEPSPEPTPSEPAEACQAEETPTESATFALVAYRAAEELVCEDTFSVVTTTWDGKALTIFIKPATDFQDGKCALDTKSVTVVQPNNGKVDKDGLVTVPYGNQKVTIEITYTFKCAEGSQKLKMTLEFTPPDGPLKFKNETN